VVKMRHRFVQNNDKWRGYYWSCWCVCTVGEIHQVHVVFIARCCVLCIDMGVTPVLKIRLT